MIREYTCCEKSSPLCFMVGIIQIGYSHQYVQSLTQNVVHKSIIKTPFFVDKQYFHEGLYSFYGKRPLSLY